MKISKHFFILVLLPLLFISGCIHFSNTSNKPANPYANIKDVGVTLLTHYGSQIEENYALSPGLSFKFAIVSPRQTTVSLCLNSFKSGYWKITGDSCVVKHITSPGLEYYVSLPNGGDIFLQSPLDHDITEHILVNICYNFNQTLTITGCLNKQQTCKFDIDNSNKGYLHIYNIFSRYDITKHRYVLSFVISYHPYNWTYITDNSNVLNGACYLSNVVSPETGKVSVKAGLIICESKCEHSSKTIYLSSSGETKQVSIELPSDIQDERNIITMILNISYIVFKQVDFGSITILHNS